MYPLCEELGENDLVPTAPVFVFRNESRKERSQRLFRYVIDDSENRSGLILSRSLLEILRRVVIFEVKD